MELADMNLSVLNGKDCSEIDKSIRTKLKGKPFLKCARIHIEESSMPLNMPSTVYSVP